MQLGKLEMSNETQNHWCEAWENSVSGMMFVLRHKCQSDFGGSRSLLAKLV